MNEIGHNSAVQDPDNLGLWVDEILKHQDQIASYKGEHAKRCRYVKDLVDDVYDRAKSAGITKKSLKFIVRTIVDGRKRVDALAGLDEHRDEIVGYLERLVDRHPELRGCPLFEAERAGDVIGDL